MIRVRAPWYHVLMSLPIIFLMGTFFAHGAALVVTWSFATVWMLFDLIFIRLKRD